MDNIESGEFLIVVIGGQHFGIATRIVGTVVALRPLTPLPFVPPFVEGLVNINERIVPQLDLAGLLGAAAGAGGELVLVETARSPCALRVAQILGKAEVGADALLPLADHAEALPVSHRFEWEAGNVLVLDVERIGGLIGSRELPDGERGLLGRLDRGQEADVTATRFDCIVVGVGGERYAFGLGDVVEILDLPVATPVPGAPAGVEGLAMVRDDVLLVLTLAELLGRPGVAEARGSVVVVEREGVRYGLRVDTLEGLEQLDHGCLRRIEEAGSEVEGVLASGERLYGLLTPARLIGAERHRQYQPLAPRRQQQVEQRAERRHEVLQVMMGDELFGIALGQVRRIVDYHPPEPVQADAASQVAGVVNIEGRVVPVVDLAARLRTGGGNDGAWVVVGDEAGEWALAVREASDIVSIPESALEPVQAGPDGLVSAIASVQDRLMSLLSLASLARREA
jgi:chemotaxis signal transduction protein